MCNNDFWKHIKEYLKLKVVIMMDPNYLPLLEIYTFLLMHYSGRAVLGGKKIKELPGHFCDGRKPAGFDTKQLFLSPSMRYSGVDAYARPSR